MKADFDKSHMLLSISEMLNFEISGRVIFHSEKLLSINFGKNLNFDKYIRAICQKATYHIH